MSDGVFLLNRGLSAIIEGSVDFWDEEEVENDEEERTSGLFPSLVPGVSPVKCSECQKAKPEQLKYSTFKSITLIWIIKTLSRIICFSLVCFLWPNQNSHVVFYLYLLFSGLDMQVCPLPWRPGGQGPQIYPADVYTLSKHWTPG